MEADRKTVVVPEMLMRSLPTGMICCVALANANCMSVIAPLFGKVGTVAEVVLIHPSKIVTVLAGTIAILPHTSQSPAVREMLVMFAGVAVVNETALPCKTVEDINSPTLPAVALPVVVSPGY